MINHLLKRRFENARPLLNNNYYFFFHNIGFVVYNTIDSINDADERRGPISADTSLFSRTNINHRIGYGFYAQAYNGSRQQNGSPVDPIFSRTKIIYIYIYVPLSV